MNLLQQQARRVAIQFPSGSSQRPVHGFALPPHPEPPRPTPPHDPDGEPGRQPPLPPGTPYPGTPQEDPPLGPPDTPRDPPAPIITRGWRFSRAAPGAPSTARPGGSTTRVSSLKPR
ncbi:MAG TPA: hypothetical protein VFB54_08660 [Burkholderiales bacterium]|nr:hypothetical protein [Burkholderiales bacterium]